MRRLSIPVRHSQLRVFCATVLAVCLLAALTVPFAAAQAVDTDLPTWQDVQDAKQDQAATAAKITEIEQLLDAVAREVEQTQQISAQARNAYADAEAALLQASERLEQLTIKLQESTKEADAAAAEAASLVSLMYRSGGIDRSVEMFLEDDASASDQLLERLASISKATERNSKIADEAARASNDAKSLSEQADAVTQERERLRVEAEQRKEEAATAAAAAVQKQAEQQAQKELLETQLEALKDTTTKTVAGYEERLRQEEEDRRKARETPPPSAAQPPAGGGSGWGRPLTSYTVTDEFGGSRNHGGIDLAAPMWTPIYAAAAGTVTACYEFSNYGNTIDITHPDGSMTRYAHQPYGGLVVACGQWVSQGQQIGHVGSTGWSSGPHLHFETWPTSSYRVNPRGFMAARGVWF